MPTPAEDLCDWLHTVFDAAEGADDDNATIASLMEAPKEEEENIRAPEQYARTEELLSLPDIRQDSDFSCGAAVAFAVSSYLGIGPDTLGETEKALGTNVRTSTQPEAIVDFFESLGCTVEAREGMTLEDLRAYWQQGIPVLCLVTEYGAPDPKAKADYGHWVASVGVGMGMVFVRDPSIDNVLEGEYADQASGLMPITEEKWMKVWHAQARKGDELKQFGIAIFPPERTTREAHQLPESYARVGDPERFAWTRYIGPRGGKGGRNSETGEIRYGGGTSGGSGHKADDAPLGQGAIRGTVDRDAFKYTDHASNPKTTCATCRFFEDGRRICHLYEDMNLVMPETFSLDAHVEPTGWCKEWTAPEEA